MHEWVVSKGQSATVGGRWDSLGKLINQLNTLINKLTVAPKIWSISLQPVAPYTCPSREEIQILVLA